MTILCAIILSHVDIIGGAMASTKQLVEKKDNISSILSFIRKNTGATRMELSSGLSLSWACVSDLVALLLSEGILTESPPPQDSEVASAKGRTPTRLSFNEEKYVLGVDINDSGIAITVLSMSGKLISAKKWEEEIFDDEEDLSQSVCEKIETMLLSPENCCGIGIAMEGTRTADGGWRYPVRIGSISAHPQTFINERFGLPTFARHDPECVLYSVTDRSSEDCILIRVDNGVGVAALKHGKILELPLELGHTYFNQLKLKDILKGCIKQNDYRHIAEALGSRSGDLTTLLGIKKCFLAGDVSRWFESVSGIFEEAFKRSGSDVSYELCSITDASDGAARLAMAEYSPAKTKTDLKKGDK